MTDLDNLTVDATRAANEGMSYGTWKVLHPETQEENKGAAAHEAEAREKERQRQWEDSHRRTCPICGKEFTSRTCRMYCSDECRKKANPRKRTPSKAEKAYTVEQVTPHRVCLICGGVIHAVDPRVKYCCSECRRRAARIREAEYRDRKKAKGV